MSKRRERSESEARRAIKTMPPFHSASKFGARQHFRARHRGALNQDLVVAHLAENEEAAVRERRDGGERRARKPVPFGLEGARLEPEFLGAAEHFRHAEAHRAEAVRYLAGVGGDAVKLQQHDERGEARIPVAIHGDALALKPQAARRLTRGGRPP